MRQAPPIIHVLLLSSLVLTIARGVTLPFITVYLVEHFFLSQQAVGVVMGTGLAIAIILSFFGGYLVDKFNRMILAFLTVFLFGMGFILFPMGQAHALTIILIALFNTAYNVWSINQKAYFAQWLPIDKRIRIFSLNYTVVNIGWAIGSALGVYVVRFHELLPFYLSATMALIVLILLLIFTNQLKIRDPNTTNHHLSFLETIKVLKTDNRLVFFTLGSTLGSLVFGQFTGYLSQYIITISNSQFAYSAIGAMMTTNAVLVIVLQYYLSKFFKHNNLMKWLVVGSLFFSSGLVVFMFAETNLWLWVLGMAIFTLGEIILLPVEYLFIDFIAPAHLKGSYYGVQNLSNMGGAINPMIAGFLLTHFFPNSLFITLVVITFCSLFFFYKGYHLTEGATHQEKL